MYSIDVSVKDSKSSSVTLEFVVHNSSSSDLFICKYFTPFESLCGGSVVTVVDQTSAVEIPYKGIMKKRKAPEFPGNFDTFPANTPEGTIRLLHLTPAYRFTQGHTYQITVNNTFEVGAQFAETTIPVTPQPLTFTAT